MTVRAEIVDNSEGGFIPFLYDGEDCVGVVVRRRPSTLFSGRARRVPTDRRAYASAYMAARGVEAAFLRRPNCGNHVL